MLRACAYAGINKSRGTKFCTVTPNTVLVGRRYGLKWLLNMWGICVPLSSCLCSKGSLITRSRVAQDLQFRVAWFEPRETFGCSDRFIVIFISFFWANAGILYRLCGDCLPPRAGWGPGEKIPHPTTKAGWLKIFTLNRKACHLQSVLGLVRKG